MELAMKDRFAQTGCKQREVGEFMYAAQSWALERRVITRLEHGEQGNNPRYVVTNLTGEPQQLYDKVYCQRGEAENRTRIEFGNHCSPFCHSIAVLAGCCGEVVAIPQT
jgi:hypothetical protein